jgi:WD40 repeat protein
MSYKWAIENCPLQAYASAIVFSPARSLIRVLFEDQGLKWITIEHAIEDRWTACLLTLEDHSSGVQSVAYSHDSAQIASASEDSTAKIWDTRSGECLQTLKGHSGWVNSVAFSPDSAQLASASADKTVKIWNVHSGECLRIFSVGKTLVKIKFDNTGSCLYTEIGTIAINAYDASSTSDITASVTGPQNPQYVGGALSSDGAWIKYNSENLVWLPSEYRPSCSAASGKTIGIGVGSGKVWMCNFEPNES